MLWALMLLLLFLLCVAVDVGVDDDDDAVVEVYCGRVDVADVANADDDVVYAGFRCCLVG